MDGHQVRIAFGESLHTGFTTMSRSVVHNPEYSSGVSIRGSLHNHLDEPIEGCNSIVGFASAKDLHSVNIHCGQVRPGSEPFILMFYFHRRPRASRYGLMTSMACLNARFFVRTDHEFVFSEGPSPPTPFVQVKYGPGFRGEVRIPREDPRAMSPGSDGVLTEPAPDGGIADGRHKPRLTHMVGEFGSAPPRQRYSQC